MVYRLVYNTQNFNKFLLIKNTQFFIDNFSPYFSNSLMSAYNSTGPIFSTAHPNTLKIWIWGFQKMLIKIRT
jgi:hypothetical protein